MEFSTKLNALGTRLMRPRIYRSASAVEQDRAWKLIVIKMPKRKGFAAMSPDKQKEIASKGGKSLSIEVRREIGRKGGLARAEKLRRNFLLSQQQTVTAVQLNAPQSEVSSVHALEQPQANALAPVVTQAQE
jgi:Stress-induced bacterial acidophilic repeat motif